MRHAIFTALLVLMPSSAAFAQSAVETYGADVTAVRDVIARYVAVRDAGDAAALSALFVEDADQLVSTGEWRRGRAAVVSGSLASSARSSGARTIAVETVRFLAPDVAVADGRYEIAATGDTPARQMWTTFVLVKHVGRWRIGAIRNMRPSA